MQYLKHHCSGHKLFAIVLFFCCISVRAHASASVIDVHNIADICTSVQTVMKDYSLVGMGVKYGDPAKHLKDTIAKIDKDFASLKEKQHLGAAIDALVVENEKSWKKIRAIVVAPPQKESVLQLHISIEALDKKCWEIAELIAQATHIEGEHYVIVASELGMEVQRLAALYMMRAWDVPNPHYYEEVESVFEEFEKFYHELEVEAYPKYVDDETKAKLDDIERAFAVFKYMAASKSGRFVPTLGQRSSKKLAISTDEVIKALIAKIEEKK